MVRPRPKRGERRIDAAIDHLADYGFPRPQIRRVINDLLKVNPCPSQDEKTLPFRRPGLLLFSCGWKHLNFSYSGVAKNGAFPCFKNPLGCQRLCGFTYNLLYGREGWVFLEEGQYHVVLEKLLEEQAQPHQDQQPEKVPVNEASLENDRQVSQENQMQVSQGNDIQVEEVQNVQLTNKSQSALQPHSTHNNSPSLKPVVALRPAAQAVPARPVRPPCHGWISEESDTESELEEGEALPDIPSPSEILPFKRKRPSRWDVGPNLRG